jgi:manganese/iron transport system permease protein
MVAMLVTPAATAYLLTRRLLWMMMMAVVVACVSGVVGLYASFYLDIASGAAIVLTCTLFFLFVWGGQRFFRHVALSAAHRSPIECG